MEEVQLLQRELRDRPGVENLQFDILNSRMVVSYDDAVTDRSQIVAWVAGAGMAARPWSKTKPDDGTWWRRNQRNVSTVVSGTLLAAGFVIHVFHSNSVAELFGDTGAGGIATIPIYASIAYAASILAGIWFVAPKAWASLRRLRPDMNLLMSIAVVGALVIGEWFEAATVTFLFALALLLEHWSMERTRRAVATLLDLSPPSALCLDPATGEFEERQLEDVSLGTTVKVRPYEKIPLDGRVREGNSSVNEAPITGESRLIDKGPGDDVFAGTLNEQGTLELETTKAADDTTLARIVHMVQEAHTRRAPSEQWVETFARYYTPAMLALAVAVALFPPLVFSAGWIDWTYRALVLLVIACPCALVISTPVSIVSALTSAARHGVLVKGGRFLEECAGLQAVAMDKTGTLTYGRPVVQQIVALNGHTDDEVLARAAAMERHSQHPLARAILEHVEDLGVQIETAESYRVLSGRGATGLFDGRPFWIGSHRLMHEYEAETEAVHDQAVALEDAGHSIVAVGNDRHVCGLIAIADDVRRDAAETIGTLKRLGIRRVVMLTGDNPETGREVARAVGIDDCRADLLPEDKLREVEALRGEFASLAMLGDGVNDAPAMAAASLGIAMGAAGSDAAIEAADIALMSDDLTKLPWLIRHARQTLAIIKQNISFALGLKLVFVILTFLGAASLWMAIAADTGASLLVIFNGMRLLRA